jgi:hypothetical protein
VQDERDDGGHEEGGPDRDQEADEDVHPTIVATPLARRPADGQPRCGVVCDVGRLVDRTQPVRRWM